MTRPRTSRDPGSCRECHAWGVTRTTKWLCHACYGWRQQYPTVAACRWCGHRHHIGRGDACRLCWRQASDARRATRRQRPYRPLDLAGANRHGQQLHLAGMGRRRLAPRPPTAVGQDPAQRPRRPRQLNLLDPAKATWASRRNLPEPSRSTRAQDLDALVRDHADRHGWSASVTKRTRTAVRVLARNAPTAVRFRASDVLDMQQHGLHARPVLAVLADNDLLDDDRTPAVLDWFQRHTGALPLLMTDELRLWFDVQLHGTTTPPRRRPRTETTVRVKLNWALPALRRWAAEGHTSLREISRDDVLAVLPASGNPRSTLGQALRSIFKTLRDRRIVFTDPTARIRIGSAERREPLPVDVDTLRQLLDSPHPATAAVAALIVFHGLRPIELRELQLTDLRDGRAHIRGRTIPLAPHARARLARWLDYRHQRWPASANPHLFIHLHTSGRLSPVGPLWLFRRLGIAPTALRADRILDEAAASSGDVRQIADLFGITVKTAERYTRVLNDTPATGP